jgi:hypothetical protein
MCRHLGAQIQQPWYYPRNHVQGPQQENQPQENPVNTSLPQFTSATKGMRKGNDYPAITKGFLALQKGFAMDFLFKSAHSKNTLHMIQFNVKIFRNTPNA